LQPNQRFGKKQKKQLKKYASVILQPNQRFGKKQKKQLKKYASVV